MTARRHRSFRRFHLVREEDVSGTSGVGVVAEGVVFSTGKVTLAWTTRFTSVAVYDSLAELEAIHGHEGRTRVEWVDESDLRSLYKDKVVDAARSLLAGYGTTDADDVFVLRMTLAAYDRASSA